MWKDARPEVLPRGFSRVSRLPTLGAVFEGAHASHEVISACRAPREITQPKDDVVALLDDATGTLERVVYYTPEGLSTHYDDSGQVLCDEEASLLVTCTELNMPFGFNGMWRSNTTGLSHMRNRWYSPQLGQFMSHDPLEYIDSYDLYAFAKLDPINFWDPWGLSGGSLVPNYASGGSVMEGTSGYLSASPTNFASFDSGMFIDHSVGSSNNSPPAANSGTSAQRPQPSRPGSNRNRKRSIAQGPGLPSNALACGGRLQLECSTFVNQGGGGPDDPSVFNDEKQGFGFRAVKFWAELIVGESVSAVVMAPAVPLRIAGGVGKTAGGLLARAGGWICKNGRCQKLNPAKLMKPCSFTEDTPVLMCDGSVKSIDEVEIGDSVLARSKLTGEIACREVMNLSEPAERSIILVTLESMDGTSEVIATTENHPFFVEGLGWTRVDDLVPGDLVPSATNGLLTVSALEWTDRMEIVYNFGVDEFHTYFVGEVGAWVHNCFYNSIKDAPAYPKDFVKGKLTKHNVKDKELLNDVLRKEAPGEWNKVYLDGKSGAESVSVHYFQHAKTGKVFNVKVKPGHSNK
ncbi:polymorphic toxin-type HINT domain-containing protein [Microvenator marinus]|uniref:polymorphic toxin-type HINT domain-containing protein n=1 Tax=Microvenator marinus TaxID=2600177 RepID=UPI00201B610F|nr:polymorphic toxin-type HINT domain-containing protein [Microvenator marinus]